MNKSATVTKITLNIGGKIVELTPEQAKDLEKILHEMFGNTYSDDGVSVLGWNYNI
jgi:hypothetical protein